MRQRSGIIDSMPRSIADMLAALHAVHGAFLTSAASDVRTSCQSLVAVAPLVHRTGRAGATAVTEILASETLLAQDSGTECERGAGMPRSVYFFLGSASYPLGNFAFLLRPMILQGLQSNATPFDSGACGKGYLERTAAPFIGENERCHCLDDHTLDSTVALSAFAHDYILCHFDNPVDYVKLPQISLPDRPTYHGLESMNRDRRAWTIEVQCREHLSMPPDPHLIERIVVEDRDLLAEIPLPYRRLALVAAPLTIPEAVATFCISQMR